VGGGCEEDGALCFTGRGGSLRSLRRSERDQRDEERRSSGKGKGRYGE
jgi:hypothetical protein